MDHPKSLFDFIDRLDAVHKFSQTAHVRLENIEHDLASIHAHFAQLKAVIEDFTRGIENRN